MSLGIFKKAFSTVQIEALKSYFENLFAPNYMVYRALMTTSIGGVAPSVTVLENTIGDIVWTYSGSSGVYEGTLTGAFPAAKCFIQNASGGSIVVSTSGSGSSTYFVYRNSDNIVRVQTTGGNVALTNLPIEIVVYF